MQYTTYINTQQHGILLFYLDFKDTFVCNTQRVSDVAVGSAGCFIRISKILLYAIHNVTEGWNSRLMVVLSGFQRYFWMQYTTSSSSPPAPTPSFYQDFKDTFVCNTQQAYEHRRCDHRCFIRISKILFVCNTQRREGIIDSRDSCFIRILKILLYAIHNRGWDCHSVAIVVLSGCQ